MEHTLNKRRQKDSTRLRDHTALAPDTDGRPHIISRDHAGWYMCTTESSNGRGGTGFELVLKDDQAEEPQIRLDRLSAKPVASADRIIRKVITSVISPLETLSFDPRQSRHRLACQSNDTESMPSVE